MPRQTKHEKAVCHRDFPFLVSKAWLIQEIHSVKGLERKRSSSMKSRYWRKLYASVSILLYFLAEGHSVYVQVRLLYHYFVSRPYNGKKPITLDRPIYKRGKGMYLVLHAPTNQLLSQSLSVTSIIVLCPTAPKTFEDARQNIEDADYDKYRNEILHTSLYF